MKFFEHGKNPAKKPENELPINKSVPDAILVQIYNNLAHYDPTVDKRIQNLHLDLKNENDRVKLVDRRAPLFYLKTAASKSRAASHDPALKYNSLKGKLINLIATSSAFIAIFFQTLIYSKIRYNIKSSIYSSASSKPHGFVFYELGALHTNSIREGDWFRLFWSCCLHSGWFHLIFNVLCQCQFFLMYEPDWGFCRTFFIFVVSAIGGNLVSAVADPCSLSVGSSGGLFGLIGSIFIYCAEFWDTMPKPIVTIFFTLVVIVIAFIDGFTGNTNNWAHFGGLITGFSVSLLTMTSFNLIKKKKPPLSTRPPPQSNYFGSSFVRKYFSSCSFLWYEWLLRAIGLIFLIVIFLTCLLCLYSSYEFQPPGSVKFKNTVKCVCCYMNVKGLENPRASKVPYYCFQYSLKPSTWPTNWNDFCSLSPAEQSKYPALTNFGVVKPT